MIYPTIPLQTTVSIWGGGLATWLMPQQTTLYYDFCPTIYPFCNQVFLKQIWSPQVVSHALPNGTYRQGIWEPEHYQMAQNSQVTWPASCTKFTCCSEDSFSSYAELHYIYFEERLQIHSISWCSGPEKNLRCIEASSKLTQRSKKTADLPTETGHQARLRNRVQHSGHL